MLSLNHSNGTTSRFIPLVTQTPKKFHHHPKISPYLQIFLPVCVSGHADLDGLVREMNGALQTPENIKVVVDDLHVVDESLALICEDQVTHLNLSEIPF